MNTLAAENADSAKKAAVRRPEFHSIFLFSLSAFFAAELAFAATAFAQDQLRRFETRHYILHTDVDADFASDLQRRLDLMYEEYARRLADFVPANQSKKFEVYVFSSRADYDRLTNNNAPNSAGVFIRGKNILAAFLEHQTRDNVRKTLQHEAFHQFADTAIGENLPTWLNEGLAQVFEEAIFTGNQFSLGQLSPQRLRRLRDVIESDRIIPFAKFLAMSNREWHENMLDKKLGDTEYTQAWAMTHFLVFAKDENGNPRFRTRLIDMLKLIHNGQDGGSAFKAAFSDNIDGFQQRFMEWAAASRPTPEASYMERQDILAGLLTKLKAQGRTFDSAGAFRKEVVRSGYHYTIRNGGDESNVDLETFFSDLQGRPFDDHRMYFRSRRGAPLDDLICQPMPGLIIESRFTAAAGGKIDHEIVVEKR
jgi:hypothetical protein